MRHQKLRQSSRTKNRTKEIIATTKNLLRNNKIRQIGKGITPVQPLKIDKQDDVKKKDESFQRAMAGTLTVARALGLFPVMGLRPTQGLGARELHFRPGGFLALLSAASLLPLLAVVLLALYYVGRSLASSSKISGGVANSTAGAVFYGNSLVAAMLLRGIARGWGKLGERWEREENSAPTPLPRLCRALSTAARLILVLAMVEHLLSVAIQTTECRKAMAKGTATLKGCLEEYCMRSHSFIFTTVTYTTPLGLLIFFISKVATFTWNFQDLFLIQISLGLTARFKHINSLIHKLDPETVLSSQWRSARELFAGAAGLAREAGQLLSPLVLLSFINNLYFICLQMLNGLGPSKLGALHGAYFFFSFGFIVVRVTCVALAASAVPLEARRALPALRCCPTRAYCVEVERLTCQLVHDEVALTGMGFFTVNRNFMLGVAGAIATYEVVLLQFDSTDRDSTTASNVTSTTMAPT